MGSTRKRRPRQLPPVVTWDPRRGTIEGLCVLEECKAIPAGATVLWTALRACAGYARTPPTQREGLYSPEASANYMAEYQRARTLGELPASLWAHASDMGAVLAPEEPRTLDLPEGTRTAIRAAAGCAGVSRWAEESGLLETALEFAQTAALLVPGSAAAALRVAELARVQGDSTRAESWYLRALTVARRAEEWGVYARAYLATGELRLSAGDTVRGRRAFLYAYRAARRHGHKDTARAARARLNATKDGSHG